MTSRCVPSDDRQEVKEGAKKREKEANEEGRRGRDVSTLKYLIKFGGDLISEREREKEIFLFDSSMVTPYFSSIFFTTAEKRSRAAPLVYSSSALESTGGGPTYAISTSERRCFKRCLTLTDQTDLPLKP